MGNLNAWEIIILVLLALFIFGPERLPRLITDAIRLLRRVRTMARSATDDLSRELGTQVNLEDLHPKTFIRKHLLSDDEQAALRRPFDDLAHDVRGVGSEVRGVASEVRRASATPLDEATDKAPPVERRRHEPDPDAT